MTPSATVTAATLHLPGGRALSLATPLVMGVVNVTPDSFSDGGQHLDPEDALRAARVMVEHGAAVLDVGGESTRPGAGTVSVAEELRRVLPVIERLVQLDVPISIDTRKAEVAAAALEAGAVIVNDVTGLGDPGMAQAVAEAGAALILGHIQGDPGTMQRGPRYDDVVEEVFGFLNAAKTRAIAAGVDGSQVCVDPGIGFGKTLEHNLDLLAHVGRLAELGPVVVGVSRKSMFGQLLGRPVDERLAGGLGAAVWAALAGARVVRTHDVRETVDALRVATCIQGRVS